MQCCEWMFCTLTIYSHAFNGCEHPMYLPLAVRERTSGLSSSSAEWTGPALEGEYLHFGQKQLSRWRKFGCLPTGGTTPLSGREWRTAPKWTPGRTIFWCSHRTKILRKCYSMKHSSPRGWVRTQEWTPSNWRWSWRVVVCSRGGVGKTAVDAGWKYIGPETASSAEVCWPLPVHSEERVNVIMSRGFPMSGG